MAGAELFTSDLGMQPAICFQRSHIVLRLLIYMVRVFGLIM